MLRGKTGFGGSIPCAQTAGVQKFYEEFQNPVDILLNGEYNHVPIFFGANSHEGSFINLRKDNRFLVTTNIISTLTFSHSSI